MDHLYGLRSIVESQIEKEAQMKKRIRINYIFWKEGPLLPRLLIFKEKSA
jgi:hypothetical protein